MPYINSSFLSLVCLSFFIINESTATVQILAGVIHKNALGLPMLHESQSWPFDPDAGIKNAAEYQQINGVRGEKLIERIGLGTDGQQERRLREQQRRDEGHLGGLNFFRP